MLFLLFAIPEMDRLPLSQRRLINYVIDMPATLKETDRIRNTFNENFW
jgi:hypothetical protein